VLENVMHRLVLIFALLAITIDARAQDCRKDDFSPMCTDMRASAQFDSADQRLNLVYQQLLRELSKPAEKYLDYPALKTKFIEAQRKWVAFRDAECDAWFVINEAGTGRDADQFKCLIDRTNDRTKQLKAWQANLSSVDD
jgi:uncharacterized protein YecT (DUF1311 family)